MMGGKVLLSLQLLSEMTEETIAPKFDKIILSAYIGYVWTYLPHEKEHFYLHNNLCDLWLNDPKLYQIISNSSNTSTLEFGSWFVKWILSYHKNKPFSCGQQAICMYMYIMTSMTYDLWSCDLIISSDHKHSHMHTWAKFEVHLPNGSKVIMRIKTFSYIQRPLWHLTSWPKSNQFINTPICTHKPSLKLIHKMVK